MRFICQLILLKLFSHPSDISFTLIDCSPDFINFVLKISDLHFILFREVLDSAHELVVVLHDTIGLLLIKECEVIICLLILNCKHGCELKSLCLELLRLRVEIIH